MKRDPAPAAVLPPIAGVFPTFDEPGGVQVSGRLAWEAIAAASAGRADLVTFGRVDRPVEPQPRRHEASAGKWALALRCARVRWHVELALYWHAGLLALRPFLRGRGPVRTAVFVRGVEIATLRDPRRRRRLGRVDLILHNSRHTWAQLVAACPEMAGRPHRHVPLGIGAPTDPPPRRTRSAAALIVGRMEKAEDYKGHRELIAAWPEVRRIVPGAELWIAGDGSLRPELERAARGRPGICFFGRVSEREKERLLARARCLAMPSRGEGFGLVYLEAMRLGTPCLVGPSDGGREVVAPPQAGLAVDPSDAHGLRDALARLLAAGSAEWERWSAAARQRYAREFTAAAFRRRLIEALRP